MRAYFALRDLHKLGSFFSWLVGIADRVVKETWRDKKRRQCVAFDERQMPESHTDSGDSSGSPGNGGRWPIARCLSRSCATTVLRGAFLC